MKTKAVVVDASSIISLHVAGGYNGLDILGRDQSTIVITPQVFDEIMGSTNETIKTHFREWLRNMHNQVYIPDIKDIDLGPFPVDADGNPKQRGDLSIEYFVKDSKYSDTWDAKILADDKRLINFDGGKNSYKSTYEFLGNAVAQGDISKTEYQTTINQIIEKNRFNNISPKYEKYIIEDSLLKELDVLRLRRSGINLSGKNLAAIIATAETLRHLGPIGDLLGLGITAAHAAELAANDDIAGAHKVWVRYGADLAGGTLGTSAGVLAAAALATATGVGAVPAGVMVAVGALVGGVAGGVAGDAFATYFYEKIVESGETETITPERVVEIYDEFRTETGEDLPNLEDLADEYRSLHNEGPPYCFAAGTPVELPDGTSKPIEEVKVGDEVLAYDASDRNGQGELAPRRVTRTYATPDKLVIDFHGLKVTPGHVFLCGNGEFAGQHRMLMEILRSDGTIVGADGTVLRAATNAPVESREDAFVQVAYLTDGNDSLMQSGRMRAGTLILTPEGESKTVLTCLEEDGYRFDAESGLIAKDGEEPHALYWYGEIPRPEDYVLKRSELTDADLYAEPGYQPEVAAAATASKLGRGITPAEGTLHATAAKQAGETIH